MTAGPLLGRSALSAEISPTIILPVLPTNPRWISMRVPSVNGPVSSLMSSNLESLSRKLKELGPLKYWSQ